MSNIKILNTPVPKEEFYTIFTLIPTPIPTPIPPHSHHIITKQSILDIAAALDPPLKFIAISEFLVQMFLLT